MGFLNRLSSTVQSHRSRMQAASERRRKASEARERAAIKRETAKTLAARKKLASKRKLYEERATTNAERAAMIKARRDAGITTTSERLDRFGRQLGKEATSAFKSLMKTTNKATAPRKPRVMRIKDGKFARRRVSSQRR